MVSCSASPGDLADRHEPNRIPELQTVKALRVLRSLILTEAKMRKCGRFVLIAIMLALAATALTLGNAGKAQAEPPDPCHYFGFCDE
jgi:hypothetical protein